MLKTLLSVLCLTGAALCVSLRGASDLDSGLYFLGIGQDPALSLYHVFLNGTDYKRLSLTDGQPTSGQVWLEPHPPTQSILFSFPDASTQQSVYLYHAGDPTSHKISLPVTLHTYHWDPKQSRMLATWLDTDQSGDYQFTLGTVDPAAGTVAALFNVSGVLDGYTSTAVSRFDHERQVLYVLRSVDRVGTAVVAVDVTTGESKVVASANATQSFQDIFVDGAGQLYGVVLSPRVLSRDPSITYSFNLAALGADGPDMATSCSVGSTYGGTRPDTTVPSMFRVGHHVRLRGGTEAIWNAGFYIDNKGVESLLSSLPSPTVPCGSLIPANESQFIPSYAYAATIIQ